MFIDGFMFTNVFISIPGHGFNSMMFLKNCISPAYSICFHSAKNRNYLSELN